MKVLTIIIPSYNAEKFLGRGVPTLLEESILGDIEVLIVNDGSKDLTAEIAEEYQRKYPGTVKAVHKENGGHGSTINSGIQLATGKYFCVIDADDWVDTGNFVKLVKFMRHCDADLVLADAVQVNAEDKSLGYKRISKLPKQKKVILDDYIGNIKNIEMHNYFIASEILKKNNIRCHEHYFYVDQEFVLYSLLHVKTAVFMDMVVYHYLIDRKGQSVSIESRRKNYNKYIDVTNFLIDFYQKNYNGMTTNQRRHYEGKIAWFIRGTYSTLLSYHSKEKKKEMERYDREVKKQSMVIYRANQDLCIKLLRLSRFTCYGLLSRVYRVVRMKCW